MIITQESVKALAACAMQLDEDGQLAFDDGGKPNGVEHPARGEGRALPRVADALLPRGRRR